MRVKQSIGLGSQMFLTESPLELLSIGFAAFAAVAPAHFVI